MLPQKTVVAHTLPSTHEDGAVCVSCCLQILESQWSCRTISFWELACGRRTLLTFPFLRPPSLCPECRSTTSTLGYMTLAITATIGVNCRKILVDDQSLTLSAHSALARAIALYRSQCQVAKKSSAVCAFFKAATNTSSSFHWQFPMAATACSNLATLSRARRGPRAPRHFAALGNAISVLADVSSGPSAARTPTKPRIFADSVDR